jgi:hypothetical protein
MGKREYKYFKGKILKKKNFRKWAPLLKKCGVKDKSKLDWLSQYAEHHSAFNSIMPISSSTEEFPSLLPIAMRVAATTIGLDLVATKPMGGDYDLIKKAEIIVKATNRERKIDSVVDDIKYEPLDIKDTDEYKEYQSQGGGPKAELFYIDFKYDDKLPVKEIPQINLPKLK